MANKIRELRQERNLTLPQFSAQLKETQNLDITSDALSKYERGDREPKLETWEKLANFFNVSTSYLQGIDDGFEELSHSEYRKLRKFIDENPSYDLTNYLRLRSLHYLDLGENAGWEYEKHLTDHQIDLLLESVSAIYNSWLAYDGNSINPDPKIDDFFEMYSRLVRGIASLASLINMADYDNSKHGVDYTQLLNLITPMVSKIDEVDKKVSDVLNAQEN